MTIILHKVDRSPPVRAVLMTLEYLNLKYEGKDIDTLKGGHLTPEYLEKNPIHTVPLLEDGDFALADSHAIITYLVAKYGAKHSKLYPNDERVRATVDQRLFFEASILFPRLKSFGTTVFMGKSNNFTESQIADLEEAYGFMEKYLQRTKYLVNDDVTLADISCVASISSTKVIIPIDANKYPKLCNWLERLEKEDWYQKANIPGLKNLETEFKKAMERNKMDN